MKLEPDSYILRIDGKMARQLGWTPTTELELEAQEGGILLITAQEKIQEEKTPQKKEIHNGKMSRTRKQIEDVKNSYADGAWFRTEQAAEILKTSKKDVSKVLSYGVKLKEFVVKVDENDKRLRLYQVAA